MSSCNNIFAYIERISACNAKVSYLRNIGIHTTKYYLIIKITTQHKCDNQTSCNFTNICAVNYQVLFVTKKTQDCQKA